MINARTFLGYPTDFQGICFIYPPLIKDIVGCEKYQIYQRIFTIRQEDLDDMINEAPLDEMPKGLEMLQFDENGLPIKRKIIERKKAPGPFDYLMNNAYKDEKFLEATQQAFDFFIHTRVTFLWELKCILLCDETNINNINYGDANNLPILKEDNYLQFQNAIRTVLGLPLAEIPDPNEDPRITRMKAKARYRDKIKAQGGAALNLESMLAAICCSNLGITPLTIGEISYGTVKALFEMYQNKEKYELDISSLLAGADPHKVKPKHWITNLND